jgi:hypothetical protein
MPQYLRKFCMSMTLSCGFFVALFVLAFLLMTSMRSENTIRKAWVSWVHN